MAAARSNIHIVKSKHFAHIWGFEFIDLRAHEWRVNWRSVPVNDSLPEFTVEVLDGQTSELTEVLISLTESQTAALDENAKYYYDLESVASGVATPLIHGEALLERYGE